MGAELLRYLFYNLTIPLTNRRRRRRLLPEWIAAGYDPADFPMARWVSLADFRWASGVMREWEREREWDRERGP